MPALPLTKEQLEDAARLKQHFLDWQKRQREAGLPFSQESASEQLGFNQSAMSQYLNGKIPLNVDAATKFADLLGCQLSSLSPAIADQAAKYAFIMQGTAPERTLPRGDARNAGRDRQAVQSAQVTNHLQAVETPSALKLQWITEQEAELLSEFRACEQPQKQTLLAAARGLPKAVAITAARDKA